MQPEKKLEKSELEIAFIPITCCAPLLYAHRCKLFEKHGLKVNLRPAPGWSGIKELIEHEKVDGVHMFAPMPLASQLGINGRRSDIILVAAQNINGQALTLSKQHLGINHVQDMKGFTFGVPYFFSMHYYLLCYFLAEHGVNPLKDVKIIEVSPPRMPYYLEKGYVDGYFAPDPWNQVAVYRDIGFIYILSKDILPRHLCCCFATTHQFKVKYPNTYMALLKTLVEAEYSLHTANLEEKKKIAKEIFSYLELDDPIPLEQVLTGTFPDGKGNILTVPDRIDFVPYPWEKCGVWMLTQMQRWGQLPGKVDYHEVVEKVFASKEVFELSEQIGFEKKTTG